MIDAVNVAVQTVNVNSPVLFGSTRIKTGCAIRHEEGSGRFVLLKPGVYEISFSANMTSAAAATATFNITQDGEQIAGAKIVSSIAAAGVNNVSCTTLARVYCSDVSSVSVTNIGATAIDVSDANMTITRLC